MSRLLLNPSVLLATADDGYLAYNVESNRLYRLNATAALLVELCDGTRTAEQIVAALGPLVDSAGASGCAAWLDGAIGDQLVIAASAPSSGSLLAAAGLHALATSLRRQDRVLAAYICQHRATELAPDDPQQWYSLAELAHIVGRRDEARAAYEKYQAAHPDDIEVEHLLLALRDDAPPPRASDEYIEQLYSYFAPFYDDNMCGDLDYRAPNLLSAALAAALPSPADLKVLDLGCGTGLFGMLIRPLASYLTGVDLSTAMIEWASERKIYDALETAELTQWLSRPRTERFDAIGICDTLIYFGDLRQVLPAAGRLLSPGGTLGFTVERGETFPFSLTDSGRFAHHQDHLCEVAAEAGLSIASQTAEVLRYEYGEPVTGWVTVLRNCSDVSRVPSSTGTRA